MVTPFRQTIKLGNKGADVYAVRRALRKRGYKLKPLGYTAGPALIDAIKHVQKNHKLTADGVYGPATHAIIAQSFDKFGVWLYKRAKIRALVPTTAKAAAQLLLHYSVQGLYHADNPGDFRDIEATAAGRKVPSALGYSVWIDPRPLQLLCHLIGKGFRIGTYAICSDHFNDGIHGHAGGLAVDISSINGVSVGSLSSRNLVIAVDKAIHAAPNLYPRQLITGGYGYHRDSTISSYSIPGADWAYGSTTMSEHCNHIHAGY